MLAVWLQRAAFEQIQDITAQVRAMRDALTRGGNAALHTPRETVYPVAGRV